MTTPQKAFVTAVLVAAIRTVIYQTRRASTLQSQIETLQQQQAAHASQIAEANHERDDAIARQLAVQRENEPLRVIQLSQSNPAAMEINDPFTQSIQALTKRAMELNRRLEEMPDKRIPELQLLTENDWLSATEDAKFDTDANIRKSISKLRSIAKTRLMIGSTLYNFTQANNGQLPTDLDQLKPYFRTPLDDGLLDAILERYTLLHTGNLSDFPFGEWFITEKAPVDKEYDSRVQFGNGHSRITDPWHD